jgi:tRNA (mo5U34)-methyltransferase
LLITANDRAQQAVTSRLTEAQESLEQVTFLLDVSDEELASLYANAAMFVYASLHEGFGIPILEAMHAGCPVVTSATSSMPEVGGQAVEYVDPMDPASIRDGMQRLLDDPALRQRRSVIGKRQASQFTWQKAAVRTADLYHYILLHHGHEFAGAPAPPPSPAAQPPGRKPSRRLRGQPSSLPRQWRELTHRICQKFEGLWVGLICSIQLAIYGLTTLPASQFVALIAGVPFVLAWYLRNRRNWHTIVPPLVAERNRLRTELNKAQTKAQDVHTQLAQLGMNTSRLEQQERSLQQHLATRDAELNSLQQLLATYEAELNSLQQHLATREAELRSLQQLLATRDAELNSLQQLLATHEAELRSLQQLLATREAELNSLQQHFATRDAQVLQLRPRVTALENHIARLRHQVTAYTVQMPQLYFASTVDKEEIANIVQAYDEWYHQFIFPGNIITPSQQKTPLVLQSLEDLGLPRDATGLRVLDVGCCDGFYSFLMERRGAEVVSIDYRDVSLLGFGIARRIIGSSIVPHVDTIYNITPDKYGTFDIVLFLGVLYHLRHPILGLDCMHRLVKPGGRIFIETHMIDPNQHAEGADDAPAMSFFYKRDAWHDDFTNYFGPNRAAVEAWLDAAGFVCTGFSSPTGGRGCFAALAVRDVLSEKYRDLEWEPATAQSL